MSELNVKEVNDVLIDKRRMLLKSLKNGAKTTKNLKGAIGTRCWHLTRYHLKILTNAGFIKSEKQENTTLYSITAKGYDGLKHFGE